MKLRLNNFPQAEIRLRRLAKQGRFLSGMARAAAMPWVDEIKPDFLGIGAPRAASTWLHNRLSDHPGIYLPHEKELHFFDARDRDDTHYRFRLNSGLHRRWYSLHFSKGARRVKGEITPAYSFLPPERIREVSEYLPDIRLLYILRNPVERAWSGIRRRVWFGKGSLASSAAPDELLRAAIDPAVLSRGDYLNNLRNWNRYYPPERMQIIFYEDIRENGRAVLEQTCIFLGVDPGKLPADRSSRQEVNRAPASDMPAEVRQLLTDHYLRDRSALEELLGRDLGQWYSNH